MNILHIINDLGAGGAQRVLHNITKKESSNSHVIFVLSGTGYYSKFWDSSNLNIFYFNMNSFNFIFALTSIHRIVKKHQIDVIQTWLYISDLVGIIYSLFNPKIKLFWNIRNGLVNSKVLSLGSLFAVKICSVLSFLPTKIICVSKKSIEYHHGLGYSLKKFVLIHNFIDTHIFKPQNRADFSENKKPVKFGVAARFDIQKGHENLFKALSFLNPTSMDIEIYLMGDDMIKTNKKLMELLESSNVQFKIHFGGLKHKNEEIVAFYNNLDFHISPSLSEAFPNAVAESLSCGVPNIVTDVGESSYILGDCGWVVPASNERAMARAIKMAYQEFTYDKTDYLKKREKARSRIIANFREEEILGKYNECWKRK